ncbi:MAG TPA: helix-turn-helix transcriptional regulator [Pseudomonadales bacterium]
MSEALLEETLDFGALLKDWRAHRRVSQLALSSQSGISQRHISFLETGRSRPSRA